MIVLEAMAIYFEVATIWVDQLGGYEDPEEDPVDYPANGGDNDDNESSDDDNDGDDDDVEKDGEDDEE
nr:hypothetical protein [Tanacetum cinerariifolium]